LGIRSGATPRGRLQPSTPLPADPSKQDISTLLGIGHFYFALTRADSGKRRLLCGTWDEAHCQDAGMWRGRFRHRRDSRWPGASSIPPGRRFGGLNSSGCGRGLRRKLPAGKRAMDYAAFRTLPLLRQEVQTLIRLAAPLTTARTVWRLRFHRRFVTLCA
jgi:hypothetical protein